MYSSYIVYTWYILMGFSSECTINLTNWWIYFGLSLPLISYHFGKNINLFFNLRTNNNNWQTYKFSPYFPCFCFIRFPLFLFLISFDLLIYNPSLKAHCIFLQLLMFIKFGKIQHTTNYFIYLERKTGLTTRNKIIHTLKLHNINYILFTLHK